MPRQSRIDAPGALHHIIARGIDRNLIFRDDVDRNRFLERLGTLLKETRTGCYAWALMPNHFHLLLRTGVAPVAALMRRLLTGHAIVFNRRHRRWGHLFQNRYKSILCQEDPYFLELVRYIHLNPVRAKMVDGLEDLDDYPFSGHCAIMGTQPVEWQDTQDVLRRFGRKRRAAQKNYRTFVRKGIELGRRPELTGGGLIRSLGGWEAVKKQRNQKSYMKGDERILGDSDFVDEVLRSAAESLQKKYQLKASGLDADQIAERVAALLKMPAKEVWAAGKHRKTVAARSLLCYWSVRLLGLSMSSLSKRLGISPTSVSCSVLRGEQLVKNGNYNLKLVQ